MPAMSEGGPAGNGYGLVFWTIPTPSAHWGFPRYPRWPVRPWLYTGKYLKFPVLLVGDFPQQPILSLSHASTHNNNLTNITTAQPQNLSSMIDTTTTAKLPS